MLPVTLTLAGAAALINIWLIVRVAQVRRRENISVGDGGNEALLRRMRAQANFIEFAPLVLILIALIEMAIGASVWLYLVGGAFLLARLFHAIGMDGNKKARVVGMLVSLVVLFTLAVWALALPYTLPHPIKIDDNMVAEPLG